MSTNMYPPSDDTVIKAAEPKITEMREEIHKHMLMPLLYLAGGREVCAKRKRKLQKRSNVAIRFWRTTTNGKARYRWLPKLSIASNAERNGSRSESDCRAKLGDLEKRHG